MFWHCVDTLTPASHSTQLNCKNSGKRLKRIDDRLLCLCTAYTYHHKRTKQCNSVFWFLSELVDFYCCFVVVSLFFFDYLPLLRIRRCLCEYCVTITCFRITLMISHFTRPRLYLFRERDRLCKYSVFLFLFLFHSYQFIHVASGFSYEELREEANTQTHTWQYLYIMIHRYICITESISLQKNDSIQAKHMQSIRFNELNTVKDIFFSFW